MMVRTTGLYGGHNKSLRWPYEARARAMDERQLVADVRVHHRRRAAVVRTR